MRPRSSQVWALVTASKPPYLRISWFRNPIAAIRERQLVALTHRTAPSIRWPPAYRPLRLHHPRNKLCELMPGGLGSPTDPLSDCRLAVRYTRVRQRKGGKTCSERPCRGSDFVTRARASDGHVTTRHSESTLIRQRSVVQVHFGHLVLPSQRHFPRVRPPGVFLSSSKRQQDSVADGQLLVIWCCSVLLGASDYQRGASDLDVCETLSASCRRSLRVNPRGRTQAGI